MNLARFKSLEPCCRSHIESHIQAASHKVEIFVDWVEPYLFHRLDLPPALAVHLVTTIKNLHKTGDFFMMFFQKVLYESMEIQSDPKRFRHLIFGKRSCRGIIGIATLILIFYPLSVFVKSALFFLISLTSWVMYHLYQWPIHIEVSQIKKRTQFKILDDLELLHLPSLYIIDDDEIYIGGNFLKEGGTEGFFRVTSFEERVALKLIYRDYANSKTAVEEQTLITKYLQHQDGVLG